MGVRKFFDLQNHKYDWRTGYQVIRDGSRRKSVVSESWRSKEMHSGPQGQEHVGGSCPGCQLASCTSFSGRHLELSALSSSTFKMQILISVLLKPPGCCQNKQKKVLRIVKSNIYLDERKPFYELMWGTLASGQERITEARFILPP